MVLDFCFFIAVWRLWRKVSGGAKSVVNLHRMRRSVQ